MSGSEVMFEKYVENYDFSRESDYEKALEMFLVRESNGSIMDYESLIYLTPDDTAKSEFMMLVNDICNRNGFVVKEGITTIYKELNPDHLDDEGDFDIKHFDSYVHFVFEVLTDLKFIEDEQLVNLFTRSLQSDEWKEQAITVLGLKVIHDLYAKNKLKSLFAKLKLDIAHNIDEVLYRKDTQMRIKALVRQAYDLNGKNKKLVEKIREQITTDIYSELNLDITNIPDNIKQIIANEILLLKMYQFEINRKLEDVSNMYGKQIKERGNVIYLDRIN